NHGDAAWPHSQVLALLARSSCSILRLIIRFSNITEQQLIECLKHASVKDTLKELIIHECGVKDELCEYLKSPEAVPKLQSLKLRSYNNPSPGMLYRMLRSRVGLKTVTINRASGLSQVPSEQELQLLRDQGLDISVVFDH